MSNPTTTNSTASTVDSALSNIGNTGVATVEAMILSDVPWLGFPGLKQIWEALFGWIAGYFIKAAENGAAFVIMDLQIDNEKSRISTALAAIVVAEKSGDKNAIQIAIRNYAAAQSALVHDDGSAPAI